MAPLDFRYTQVGFNLVSVQVCTGTHKTQDKKDNFKSFAKEKNKVVVSPYSADPLHKYTAKPDKLPKWYKQVNFKAQENARRVAKLWDWFLQI